tara:strand:+ start:27950 stop:28588 length:639 start_codon:yes stop_codon:yes gene_type:complete
MPTTTELTEKYIENHMTIKECLKKGLINYSSLARLIAKELNIEKKTSMEAILIASRRYKDKLKTITESVDKKILGLLEGSNIEIKNNIVIFTLEKMLYPDSLINIEKEIKKDKGLFFSVDGTKTITLMVQKNHSEIIDKKFKTHIINKKENLSLIKLVTEPEIENIPGVVNYVTSLFFENGINITDLTSCYDDIIITIDSKDTSKVMGFLEF